MILEPAAALGGVYELAVVAGVVAALDSASPGPVRVGPWDPRGEEVRATLRRVTKGLGWRPKGWVRLCEAAVSCGHLHGQTLADAWLRAHPGVRGLRVLAPGGTARAGADPTRDEVIAGLGLPPDAGLGALYDTGGAARVDLAVVGDLGDAGALLVVECSLHLGQSREGALPDPEALAFWRRLIEQAAARSLRLGGFASLRASVDERVGVAFPAALRGLYRALAQEREASKLYQGCAYASSLAPLLAAARNSPVRVTVAATTLRGYEHLAASCPAPGGAETATWRMLRACGQWYPGLGETTDDPHEALGRFDRVYSLLQPAGLTRADVPAETAAPGLLDARVEEHLTDHPRLAHIREAHGRLVRDFVAEAPPGVLSVACLTGAPGIGKTTAMRRALLGDDAGLGGVDGSWLYLYASPRIAINDDQFRQLARGGPGSCCLSANSVLADDASGAGPWVRGFAHIAGDTRGLTLNGSRGPWQRHGRATLLFDPAAEIERVGLGTTLTAQRFSRETLDLVQTTRRGRTGVLKGLATATREVLAARPDMNRVVLALTLQALRAESLPELDALFTANTRFDPGWEGSRRDLDGFARRFPTVCVMLDEITGEEASPAALTALRAWLESRLVQPFRGKPHAPRVLLLVSDASLATARALEQYLRNPEAPARVMVDACPARPHPVHREDLALALGRRAVDRVPCALIRGDGYPASSLTVGYRTVLTRTAMGDGTLEGDRGALAQRRRDTVLAVVVEALRAELQRPGGQVLVYLQNKALLDKVQAQLVRDGVVAPEEVLVLTADSPPAERTLLRDEARRDALRLVLMTSSGTRGISFPRADRLLAFLSPFAPEQDLMEFVQFAWRGRGGGGDDLARRLEVVVLDTMNDPDEDPGGLAAARRQADLAAYGLTVRAALHTRIYGGYTRGEGEGVAVVPVGRTATVRRAWHLQRMVNELSTAGARYGNDPVVTRLVAAARAFFDQVEYAPAASPPRLRWDIEQPWTQTMARLDPALGMHAWGPLVLWSSPIRDRASFADHEAQGLRRALEVFLGLARGAKRGDYTRALVHAAKKLDGLLDAVGPAEGAQDLEGLPGTAKVVMPIAWESVGDTLRSLGSTDAARQEHGAWSDALEAWATLSSGALSLDLGARSTLYRRHPFLLVYDDVDLADLRELGRRGIARAGRVANALAGLVLPTQAP